MTSYTEEQALAAWDRVFAKTYATPAPLVRGDFLHELRKGEPVLRKKEETLFTRQELLDAAATPHEKVMVYGIFAMFGTVAANEAALMAEARKANLGGNMAIVVGLAKAKKGENLTPGRTYASADGYLLLRIQGGKWRQYILDPAVRDDDFATRPLREI